MPEQCEHDWEWEDDWECSVDTEGGYNEVNNGYWSCQLCGEKDFHTAPLEPEVDEYLVDGREFYPW